MSDHKNFFAGAPPVSSAVAHQQLLGELVDSLDAGGHLAAFYSSLHGADPVAERQLALVHFYAYCHGLFGARLLASMMETDDAVRALAGGRAVTHTDLLDYRDGANERLALLFTELLVALADCGLQTFLHTPLHAVVAAADRMSRARAAAELAVTLLNAAKRRDDIENARYGHASRGDELPAELSDPTERRHRLAAVLRLRTADTEGPRWDEPTRLIDLGTLSGGGPIPLHGAGAHGAHVLSAATEARSGLLPRLRSADWESVPEGVSGAWTPDAAGDPEAAGQANGALVHGESRHHDISPAPETTPEPSAPHASASPPAPTATSDPRSSSSTPGPGGSKPDIAYQFTKAPAAPARRRDAAAVIGQWLIQRWRLVIWLLILLVVVALAATLTRF